jgi:hypothetical protein
VIRTFSPLSRGGGRDYARAMRALRHAAVITAAILAIGCAAALAVASGGGSARGDSGQGQYGAKPDCPYLAKHSWKHHSSANNRGGDCPQAYTRGNRRH